MDNDKITEARENRSLMIALGVIIVALIIVSIIGFLFINKPAEIIQGQVEGTTVKVSGMLPGRVTDIYAREGDTVKAGDTLIHIHSSVAYAKLMQAEAMESAATAQNRKVYSGTRSQIVQSAYDLWQQAIAASTIAKKTYDRMESLYSQNVVSEQKRDEAFAAYQAATAAENAAHSQYLMAKEGAQPEDRASAEAMVGVARGGVQEVEALLDDQYLTAPCDGIISEIYPEQGELVALGAPLMSVLKHDDRWVTFNVREEMLQRFAMGSEIEIQVPALGDNTLTAKIYYVGDMGDYAVWRSTKSTGEWDSRTFKIKARFEDPIPGLRPGMTAIFKK